MFDTAQRPGRWTSASPLRESRQAGCSWNSSTRSRNGGHLGRRPLNSRLRSAPAAGSKLARRSLPGEAGRAVGRRRLVRLAETIRYSMRLGLRLRLCASTPSGPSGRRPASLAAASPWAPLARALQRGAETVASATMASSAVRAVSACRRGTGIVGDSHAGRKPDAVNNVSLLPGTAKSAAPGASHEFRRGAEQFEILRVVCGIGAIDLNPFL